MLLHTDCGVMMRGWMCSLSRLISLPHQSTGKSFRILPPAFLDQTGYTYINVN
jgi:hypothetical protein